MKDLEELRKGIGRAVELIRSLKELDYFDLIPNHQYFYQAYIYLLHQNEKILPLTTNFEKGVFLSQGGGVYHSDHGLIYIKNEYLPLVDSAREIVHLAAHRLIDRKYSHELPEEKRNELRFFDYSKYYQDGQNKYCSLRKYYGRTKEEQEEMILMEFYPYRAEAFFNRTFQRNCHSLLESSPLSKKFSEYDLQSAFCESTLAQSTDLGFNNFVGECIHNGFYALFTNL